MKWGIRNWMKLRHGSKALDSTAISILIIVPGKKNNAFSLTPKATFINNFPPFDMKTFI